jgi:ligand-binding sensor domain-containing protein
LKSSSTCLDAPVFRRGLLACSLIVLAMGCFRGSAYAIDPNRVMSQYLRARWGPENGFPKGPVYAITQTKDGYLWIGTQSGLIRFDGVNFHLIAGPNGAVLDLAPDDDGSLWLRVLRPTLLHYKNGEFLDVTKDIVGTGITVSTMCRSGNGSIVVWTLRGDVGVASEHREQKFESIASQPSRSPVLSMAQMASGELWLGTRDLGLFRLFHDQSTAMNEALPDKKVNCLLPDRERLWIGTDKGLTLWDGKTLTNPDVPAILRSTRIVAMAKDRDSNIWIGTNSQGLLRLNNQGVSAFDQQESRSTEAVTALFEDREGNLWVGRDSSIERLRDTPFVTYAMSEGLPSDRNGPVYVDSEQRTWFAPLSGGLYWLNGSQRGSIDQAGLNNDIVYSIAQATDGLWIGRQRGGLTHLHAQGVSMTATTYTRKNGLAQDSVFAVHHSRDGAVWAGTLSGGLSKFFRGKFTNYSVANGMSSNTVTAIAEAADGTMWFATPAGVNTYSKGTWELFTSRDGLPSDNVNCLLEDSHGLFWVGTAEGLVFESMRKFQVPPRIPAPLREPIFGLAESNDGALWVATSNHVLRVARDKLLNGSVAQTDIREFGYADGLSSVEGIKRSRSVIKDGVGRIWFSTNRGLSVVEPARLMGNPPPALVQIQSASADGNSFELRSPLRIPPGRQRIAFGFAGLSLSVPERVRFRYKLDGFDRRWNDTNAGEREAVYTNLGPGPYQFHVVASDSNGLWNGPEATIDFRVEPAFWQTGSFVLLCLFGGALLTTGLYGVRKRQVANRLNVRFEERLAERTRVAREVHDTLLQGFLSASMQLHVAVDQMPADSAATPGLNRVLELMGHVVTEGRNTLRGLRFSENQNDDLEQALSRTGQEQSADRRIQFRVTAEGRRRLMQPSIRDEVYGIGREAIINAFRHADAKAIDVVIAYSSKHLRVCVRDDGRGIDPQMLTTGREGHWGLSGMRERAQRISAEFHIRSRQGNGTEVQVSVPAHIAYV